MRISDLPSRHICTSPYHKGQRWLPSSYFYRSNKDRKTGLQTRCITCTRIAKRAENQTENNKEYRNNYNREYKAKKRAKL